MRYFAYLSYKGTNYHGWQIQPNAISVQEVLNNTFSTLLREETEITGAGRTDTGVHASYYVAHFDSSNEELDNEKTVYKLNSFLPKDIAVSSIVKVASTAHARFDAISRSYEYHIATQKNPFEIEFAHSLYSKLDIVKMNDAAHTLYEYSDFTSFSKLHTDSLTNICKITNAHWQLEEGKLVFFISADRFLRNMVRAIVGTLLSIGSDKETVLGFRKIIEAKNRNLAGQSVPPQGLFLTDIQYPDHIFQSHRVEVKN